MKILVTGAGGSIGSALCRRLQEHELVLYEQSEYALYALTEEIKGKHTAVLGDVKDEERLRSFMGGVDVVYHCAAYKHVPLLEGHNASQAFRNNVDGTRAALEAAKSVSAFVLLSTDKAINPLGAMGRSKRTAELLTRQYGRTVARLGNILESSGSVVPKFRRQIAAGGPVTVTHPEATRYFITMDRAVEFLVSCSRREPGSYQVEMGRPVRIVDLAREMIGDRNIRIEFTGLRAGEKLHEELEVA
jgi:FlaA1/EpsC-like NDP-sugar epimerase